MAEREKWIRKRAGYFRISEIMPEVARPILGDDGSFKSRIISDWPLIVGNDIASHTLPVKISYQKNKNGEREAVLHLNVYDSFSLYIQHMEPVIIEKIAVYFGAQRVQRLKFTQVPEQEMSDNKIYTSLPVEREKKVDYSVRAAPEEVIELEKIEDSGLRSALKKFIQSW